MSAETPLPKKITEPAEGHSIAVEPTQPQTPGTSLARLADAHPTPSHGLTTSADDSRLHGVLSPRASTSEDLTVPQDNGNAETSPAETEVTDRPLTTVYSTVLAAEEPKRGVVRGQVPAQREPTEDAPTTAEVVFSSDEAVETETETAPIKAIDPTIAARLERVFGREDVQMDLGDIADVAVISDAVGALEPVTENELPVIERLKSHLAKWGLNETTEFAVEEKDGERHLVVTGYGNQEAPEQQSQDQTTEIITDPLYEPLAQDELTGKRLEISIYADIIQLTGGDLSTYLTPHQIEILHAFADTDLENYSQIAEHLGISRRMLFDHGEQIAEKLQHRVPVDTPGTRVTFDNGTKIPLAGLSTEGIHRTLVQLRRESLEKSPRSIYARLQQMSTKIEKVGKEIVTKTTAGLQGTSDEDVKARIDLITLYSGTIAQALADYATLLPNRIDEIAQAVLDDLQDRIPSLLTRAAKTEESTGRNSTGVILNRFTRQIIASYIAGAPMGEDRAMKYHTVLAEQQQKVAAEPAPSRTSAPSAQTTDRTPVPRQRRAPGISQNTKTRIEQAIAELGGVEQTALRISEHTGIPVRTVYRHMQVIFEQAPEARRDSKEQQALIARARQIVAENPGIRYSRVAEMLGITKGYLSKLMNRPE